jgi:hypothetical protein
MKVKTRWLALAAIFLFVVPTVANAGFIAIQISDESEATEPTSLLDDNFDSLFENYAESDVSDYSVSSLSHNSLDSLLGDERSADSGSQAESEIAFHIVEPGTLGLLGIGLIGMALFHRDVRTQQ